MGSLTIIKSGFLTTIQDLGRKQCQQLGLAEAGALDKHAYMWSNYLLGNSHGVPSLEILIGGCTFSFDTSTSIALAGAEMGATLNGRPVPNWSTISVNAGDVIELGFMQTGLRSYLSIIGGFKAPSFFSSCSTMVREKTGGINGQKLVETDTVDYDDPPQQNRIFSSHQTPKQYIPDYSSELILRFFPSYHFDEFEKSSIENCLASTYEITNDADRMGYRLSGSLLKRKQGNILSIGVPCGAIQVPTAGEPIILLNDRQCTGGYPILGVVAQRDIYRLAQRKAGDVIRFKLANVEESREEALQFHRFFNLEKTEKW